MAKKKVKLTDLEEKFIESIRERPQMRERFEAILAMSLSSEGEIKTADEIEAALIDSEWTHWRFDADKIAYRGWEADLTAIDQASV